MYNIFLIGASFSEHKGSAAILCATIGVLKEMVPNAKFFVCSSNSYVDRQILVETDVYIVPNVLKNSTLELALGTLCTPFNESLPIVRCLKSADVIIDISGDSFSSTYGRIPILSIGLHIISAKLLRKPVVLYCQSIGPFKGRIDKIIAKYFLLITNLVIVREFISANYLKAMGIENHVCADPAFLLKSGIISKNLNLLRSQKPVIGINLSQVIDAKYGGEKPDNKYRAVMSQFIDSMIERYNVNIIIVPEVMQREGNSYDDFYVTKEIVKGLKYPRAVTVVDAECSPSELKTIVGKCELFISPRFHMIIFALSQNVPSIAIAYSPKSYGIMNMLGQLENVINFENLSIDDLLANVDRVWRKKMEIRENLEINMVEIRTRAYDAARLVKKLLENQNE
jgi:colanic acid/amylovoran biosynthesis protein